MVPSGWFVDYPLQDTIKKTRSGDQLLLPGPAETLNLHFQSESDTPIANAPVKNKPQGPPSPQISGTSGAVGLMLSKSPLYVCRDPCV